MLVTVTRSPEMMTSYGVPVVDQVIFDESDRNVTEVAELFTPVFRKCVAESQRLPAESHSPTWNCWSGAQVKTIFRLWLPIVSVQPSTYRRITYSRNPVIVMTLPTSTDSTAATRPGLAFRSMVTWGKRGRSTVFRRSHQLATCGPSVSGSSRLTLTVSFSSPTPSGGGWVPSGPVSSRAVYS